MSDLVIRLVQEGEVGMLRSVGDPPNGVITVIHAEGDGRASWAIDPHYEPPPLPKPTHDGLRTAVDQLVGDRRALAAEPITAEDLAGGLADRQAAITCWQMMIAGLRSCVETFGPQGIFEQVLADARFAIETRDALIAVGWLSLGPREEAGE